MQDGTLPSKVIKINLSNYVVTSRVINVLCEGIMFSQSVPDNIKITINLQSYSLYI